MAGEDALFQRFGGDFKRGQVLFGEGVVVPGIGKMQKDLEFLEMKEQFGD